MATLKNTDNEIINQLREDILNHLSESGLFPKTETSIPFSKEQIRHLYSTKRLENVTKEKIKLEPHKNELANYFANGNEIEVNKIDPALVPVSSSETSGLLFRFASLLWSVPLSKGFGRRMRFLVIDKNNQKLIGIFALGDPVFNLGIRDQWIGWTASDRRERLVNVMDAYTVGAVPPYSQLLCGKLVTLLIGSSEVSQIFSSRYGNTKGLISGKNKNAKLVLVTISSVFGKSSIYNRLKLTGSDAEENENLIELKSIGFTKGYGHFHFSEEIFERIKNLLVKISHPYVKSYEFGQGPNWKMRMIRVGLEVLNLDAELLKHGIKREIYAMPMSKDCRDFLCGRINTNQIHRPTVAQISEQALNRWIIPRAKRYPDYISFDRQNIYGMIDWIA